MTAKPKPRKGAAEAAVGTPNNCKEAKAAARAERKRLEEAYLKGVNGQRGEWAQRLLIALEISGLGERDLEGIIGVESQDRITRWLDGVRVRGFSQLTALAAVGAATGVSLDWILAGHDLSHFQKDQIAADKANATGRPGLNKGRHPLGVSGAARTGR